jgi:DNA-binding transcriptional LysR family regulator
MITEDGVADPIILSPVQYSERGVQAVQRRLIARLKKLNWDDIKFLAQVSDHRSLRRAAKALTISVNTVRARLDRLEFALDCVVFYRSVSGLRLTSEGESVVSLARSMRQVADGFELTSPNSKIQPTSEVRLICSEGLSTFWLMPKLSALESKIPTCSIQLSAELDQGKIHDRAYDVSIGFERPRDPDCVASRLGTLHMMLFCSDDYVARNGEPKSIEDLQSHRFIEQVGQSLNAQLADFVLGEKLSENITKLTVNSSFALYSAIANNLGIGALPTYVRSVSKRIRPLDLPVRLRFDIWLSYDPRMKERPATRACIDWVKACFDTSQHPWFSDRFIHPNAISNPFDDSQVLPIFDRMIDDPT